MSTANFSHYLLPGWAPRDIPGHFSAGCHLIKVGSTDGTLLALTGGGLGQKALQKVQQERRHSAEEPMAAVAFWEADRYIWESGMLQAESTSSRGDVGLICAGCWQGGGCSCCCCFPIRGFGISPPPQRGGRAAGVHLSPEEPPGLG